MSTKNYQSQVPGTMKSLESQRTAELQTLLREQGEAGDPRFDANTVYNMSPGALSSAAEEFIGPKLEEAVGAFQASGYPVGEKLQELMTGDQEKIAELADRIDGTLETPPGEDPPPPMTPAEIVAAVKANGGPSSVEILFGLRDTVIKTEIAQSGDKPYSKGPLEDVLRHTEAELKYEAREGFFEHLPGLALDEASDDVVKKVVKEVNRQVLEGDPDVDVEKVVENVKREAEANPVKTLVDDLGIGKAADALKAAAEQFDEDANAAQGDLAKLLGDLDKEAGRAVGQLGDEAAAALGQAASDAAAAATAVSDALNSAADELMREGEHAVNTVSKSIEDAINGLRGVGDDLAGLLGDAADALGSLVTVSVSFDLGLDKVLKDLMTSNRSVLNVVGEPATDTGGNDDMGREPPSGDAPKTQLPGAHFENRLVERSKDADGEGTSAPPGGTGATGATSGTGGLGGGDLLGERTAGASLPSSKASPAGTGGSKGSTSGYELDLDGDIEVEDGGADDGYELDLEGDIEVEDGGADDGYELDLSGDIGVVDGGADDGRDGLEYTPDGERGATLPHHEGLQEHVAQWQAIRSEAAGAANVNPVREGGVPIGSADDALTTDDALKQSDLEGSLDEPALVMRPMPYGRGDGAIDMGPDADVEYWHVETDVPLISGPDDADGDRLADQATGGSAAPAAPSLADLSLEDLRVGNVTPTPLRDLAMPRTATASDSGVPDTGAEGTLATRAPMNDPMPPPPDEAAAKTADPPPDEPVADEIYTGGMQRAVAPSDPPPEPPADAGMTRETLTYSGLRPLSSRLVDNGDDGDPPIDTDPMPLDDGPYDAADFEPGEFLPGPFEAALGHGTVADPTADRAPADQDPPETGTVARPSAGSDLRFGSGSREVPSSALPRTTTGDVEAELLDGTHQHALGDPVSGSGYVPPPEPATETDPATVLGETWAEDSGTVTPVLGDGGARLREALESAAADEPVD